MAKKPSLMQLAVRSRQAATAAAPSARLRERDPKERRCKYDDCGKAFHPRREWQLFCSSLCRYKAWDQENPRVRIKRAGRR